MASPAKPSFRRAVVGAAVGRSVKPCRSADISGRQEPTRLPVLSAYRLPVFINRPPFSAVR